MHYRGFDVKRLHNGNIKLTRLDGTYVLIAHSKEYLSDEQMKVLIDSYLPRITDKGTLFLK